IVRLGLRGIVRNAIIDTAFFRGNFPESASLDGTSMRNDAPVEQLLTAEWRPLLQRSALQGDHENIFAIDSTDAVSHVRLNIFPDGGVARLRVHGEVVPDWRLVGGLGNEIDLAAAENGAQVLTCSDMFFGPKHNLIMPGRALNMSDGWETRRRRGPGHDWVIVRLATEGVVRRIELDTAWFKGNYPDTSSIDASSDGETWTELLPRTKLQAHTRHMFIDELADAGPITHLRLNVYPDGGVSRMRVHGVATETGRGDAAARRIDTRLDPAAELRSCCGSTEWVRRMIARRPFGSWSALSAAADELWRSLDRNDWLEAFAAHPRIGERKVASRWASQEQSGAASVSAEELAEANRAYEQRFGHIYIVCATGRSGEELLALARERLSNAPDDELRLAAEEQRKITRLRLLKLV
ncbi:MAG TPA: allantoicase, partial [Thermoanaerobaculia bacterium]|nr:allantoicase [Thermoanaerobaculia bacterium]